MAKKESQSPFPVQRLSQEVDRLFDELIHRFAGLDEEHHAAGPFEVAHHFRDGPGTDDLRALGLVREEVVDFFDGAVEGNHGIAVVATELAELNPDSSTWPKNYTYSGSYARRIFFNQVLEMAYVGTKGRDLVSRRHLNTVPLGALLQGTVSGVDLSVPVNRVALDLTWIAHAGRIFRLTGVTSPLPPPTAPVDRNSFLLVFWRLSSTVSV